MKKLFLLVVSIIFMFIHKNYAADFTYVVNDASTLKLRQFTSQNNVSSVRNCVGIVLEGTGRFAYLNNDNLNDRSTYAMVLTAISLGKKLTIVYDDSKPSPWDQNCFAVVAVYLNE